MLKNKTLIVYRVFRRDGRMLAQYLSRESARHFADVWNSRPVGRDNPVAVRPVRFVQDGG